MRVFFLLIFAFFFACTNHPDKPEVGNTGTVSAIETDLKKAIRQFPDSLLLKETLIQYYEDNGQLDQAVSEIDKVLIKDTTNIRFLNKKADLQFLNADTLGAIKTYERSIALIPDPTIIISLGALYAQTKNPMSLALTDALLANKNSNAQKEALFIKGLYYSFTNDQQKAIKYFDQCISFDYTFMPAYLEKGIVFYNTQNYTGALKIFTKATTVQNGYDEGYYWMGRCYEKLNKTSEAIESYKLALLYDAEFAEAKDALAKLGVK